MAKKRVFLFAPYSPYPSIYGSDKDIDGHIKLLRKLGYLITLFCLEKKRIIKKENLDNIDEINYLPTQGTLIGDEKYHHWYQTKPLLIKETLDLIQYKINRENPEILWFEYARFAPLASLLSHDSQVIFRAHNFEFMHDVEKELLSIKYGLSTFTNLPSKFKIWYSIYSSEKLMLRIANKVLSISKADCHDFETVYGFAEKIEFMPPYLRIENKHIVKNKKVLNVFYMGSDLRSVFNREGAYNFVSICKKVNEKYPKKFHFILLGENAESFFKHEAGAVELVDFVSDLDNFIKDMDIALLPVKSGRGMKIKMFESLARGIPTIGYPRTFSSLPESNRSYITEKSMNKIVSQFGKLLSFNLRNQMSVRSIELIENIASESNLLKCISKAVQP